MATAKRELQQNSRTKSDQRLKDKDPAYDKVFGRAGTVFTGAWKGLAEACGGVNKLVELSGIPYGTLYGWAVRGVAVPFSGRNTIISLATSLGVEVPPMKVPSRGR